jgi:hypothetical protein
MPVSDPLLLSVARFGRLWTVQDLERDNQADVAYAQWVADVQALKARPDFDNLAGNQAEASLSLCRARKTSTL